MSTRYRLTLPDGKKKYIKSEDYDRFGVDKLMTAFPGATLHSEDPNTGDEFEWGVADLKHSDFYGLRPRNYDGVDADGNKTEVVEDTNNLDGDAGKQKDGGAELGTEMTEAPENGGVNTAIGGDGQPSMAAKNEEVGEVNKNEGVAKNEGVTEPSGNVQETATNGNAQETATNGNAQGSGVKRDVTEGVKKTGAKQGTEAKKLVADYAVSRQANSAMRSRDFEQFMSAMAGTQAPSRLKNTYEAIKRGQNDVSQPKMDFQTVHRAAEASKNRAAFKKVTDMVDEAIAKASGVADKASHEAFVEGLADYENTPFKRGGDRLANMLLSKKEANRLATTDKVLAVVKKQMEKFAETPEFAKLMYITGKHKDELLKDYLLPYAQDKVIGHAVEKYTPGSTGEYYLKNLRNTLLGRGITMLTEPLSMRQQEQAALDDYSKNLGFWTKLGSEGLNLAFDLVTTMPIFEGTGAVVGKLAYTGNAMRLNRAGLNMYNAFSVASRMGGRTANFANRLMTSAGFFGSMDATNSAFAQWQLKNPDEFSFGEVAKSGAFGLATGASIGALGYGTSLLGRGRGLLAKSGISVMGATAEAGAMTGTGYVEWLLGDQKEKFDWTENFGKNMLMIGALRANGVFKGFFGRVFQLTKPGADGKAPMSTGQAFVRAGKELPGMLLGEMPNDRNLDKEEIRSVNEQGFAGKDTGEIVKNILEESGLSIQDVPEPIRNGSKEDQLQWLMTNTRIGDFMGNANIPEGAKDKLSYYFGAEMPNRIYTMASQPYEDGNGGWVIDLYSTNGSAGVGTWSKRMRFETEAQADVWVGEHYGEIQRNRIYDLELQMMHKRQAEIDAAVIDMVAKNNGVNADEVFRIYDEGRNGKYDDWKKGKKGEGAWTNEDAFMYENLMRMAGQVADKRMNQKNTAVEATALRTGRKPEEVSEIISQNWKDRKPEDQEVVDVYQHVLESRLKYGDEVAEEAPISALKIEDKRVKDLEGVAVPEGDAYFQQDFRGIGIEAKEVQGAAAESLSEAEMQHISDMFERGESNEDMVAWVSTLPKEKQEAAFALIKSNKVLQAEVAGMEVMVNGQVQKFTDGMLPFLAPGTRNYTIAKLDGKQDVYVVGQEGNMMYVKYQDGTYDNVPADRLSDYVTTNLDEAATEMFNDTMQRMGAELEFSLEHSPRTVEPSQGATIETADGMLMVVGADGERVQVVHTQYDPETGQMKPKAEQPVVMSRDEALQAQDDWHEKDMKPTEKAATKDGGEEPVEEPKKEVEEEPSKKTGEEPAEEPKEPAEETEKAEDEEAENVPENPESVPETSEKEIDTNVVGKSEEEISEIGQALTEMYADELAELDKIVDDVEYEEAAKEFERKHNLYNGWQVSYNNGKSYISYGEPHRYNMSNIHNTPRKFVVGDRIQMQVEGMNPPLIVTRVDKNGKVVEAISEEDGRIIMRNGVVLTGMELQNSPTILSKNRDQNDSPFILSSEGVEEFGVIGKDKHLPEAPVKLSLGDSENGYIHIEKRHGEQIRENGYESVLGFIEYVVKNYNQIKKGDSYENESGGTNDTYMVQLTDGHNNTLFVQLSRDGSYWNINSAGIFRDGYGKNKETIWSASEVQNDGTATNSDALQSEPNAVDGSSSNRTASNVSDGKGSETSANVQGNAGNSSNNTTIQKTDAQKRSLAAQKAAWTRKQNKNGERSKEWKDAKKEFEQAGYKDLVEMIEDTEPRDIYDVAAMVIAGGDLMYYDEKVGERTARGVASATGYKEDERKRMFSLFRGRAKGGISIDEAGDIVTQYCREMGIPYDEDDAMAGYNAIVDVLHSSHTTGDVKFYTQKRRVDQARAMFDEYEERRVMYEREKAAEEKAASRRSSLEIMRDLDVATSMEDRNRLLYELYEAKQLEATEGANIGDEIKGLIAEEASLIRELANYDTDTEEFKQAHKDLMEVQDEIRQVLSEMKDSELQEMANLSFINDRNNRVARAIKAEVAKRVADEEEVLREAIAKQEEEVNTNPTEAQKKAGNYKMGHVKVDGYEISIENPKGSTRSGKDADGKEWSVTMNNSYGYIRGTEGVDGDHIDIFLSDKPSEGNVYVVDQVNADGSFDEHKVMYGFTSMEDAKKAYLANYSEGWQGLGKITEVSKDDFKEWVNSSHRKTKPFADYKAVLDRQAQHAARLSELSADEIEVHNQDVAENGGLVVDDNSKQIGADNMAMLDLLGKSIGRQIILMTGEEMLNQYKISGRGTYDGDKIIMNLDDIQSNIAGSKTGVSAMAWIRGHEMTHALRDDNHPAVWDAFVNVVKEAMGDKFDKEFARKRALYDAEFETAKKNGAEYEPLPDDEVAEEVVANWIGYNDPFGDNTEARKMMEDAISRSEDAETLTGIILGYLKLWLRKLESMYKYLKGEAAAEMEKHAYATRVAIEAWKGMYNVAVAKNKARVEARGGKLKFAIKEPNFEENKERFGEIERQVQQIGQAIYDSKDIRDLEKRNETIRSLNEQRDRLIEEYESLAEAEKIAKKMFGLTDKDFELPKGASVGAYKDGTGKSTGFVQMEFSFPEDDGIAELGSKGDETKKNDLAELGSKGEGVKDKKEKKEKTPVDFKLRKLKPGEKCYVERRYVENGMFDFSGKEKVETADDVAYIFRNLEDSAIENLFFVLLKDGKPTIIHAGMGGLTGAPADNTAVISAVENIKPDSIIMLHNHPSGNLTPSAPDVNAHKELRKMFGDKLQDSIIIDQKSGKYSTFNDHGFIDKQQRPENQDGTVGHKVYNFSKNVFSKDYEFDKKITSADDVAAFVSSQRLGDRGKLGLLSLSNSNVLNANLFLTQNNITDSNVGKIADEVIRLLSSTSGKRGIVFGSGDMPAISKLSEAVRDKSANMFRLMDAVRVNGNSDQYESAYEKGLMEPESQYGKDDVMETTDNGSYVERRKGRIRFSLETFEDAENQKLAEAVANTSKLPKEEVHEILSDVKEVAERIVPLLDLHPDFKTAQERTLALDKNGRPTYNVYFNNKDTKAPTIEFSTNCVKKEAINNLFSALRQEGILHLMNGDNSIFEAVLDVMKKHGYQLPCDACFVEARRNQQGIKKEFAGKWNTVADLIKLPKDVYITDNVEAALDQKQEKKLREALTKYGLASIEGRIINLMLKDPSTRARFNVEDLMTVDAYEQMMQKWSGTPMEGLLKSFAGALTPKPIRTSHPYDERMFNTAYAELHPFFGESGLAYGGFRENSFSDGDPLLFFDEVQMRRNLALTQSGMFGYTKVPFMVDIFGETGEFRNMSLWLDIDIRGDEVSEKNKREDPRYQYAGLIKVGDPEHQRSLGLNDEEYEAYKSENGLTADDYDFYFSKESFPWREAMSFRKEDRFGGRVGTVVVSPSDECTWKALSDERVDMIIGYHSSGKSKEGKKRTGYNLAKDYMGENETGGIRGLRFANSYLPEMNIYAPTYFNEDQGGVDFNFDEACQTMGDARTAAKAYLEWCEINDLSPKYERFKEHENYYKLLVNFRRYDNAGSPLIQGTVKMKLPQDWATKLDMYLSEREDLLNKNNEVANDAELMKDVRKVLGVDGDDPKPKRRKIKFALKDEEDFAGNSVSEIKKRDEEYADAVNSGNRERAMEMLREEADKKLNEQLVLPTDEGVVGFQYHRGPAPKKVIPMYAVLNVTPEGFKAAYAGNQTGTPVGVWLDAQPLKSWPSDIKKNDDGSESRYVAGDTGASWKDMFTPETYEKMMAEDPSITKGTRWLYERGGKHGTDVPNFQQMNTKTDENGNKVTSAKYGALPHNKLIFEIECGMDEDGDLTAYVEKNGRFVKKKNQGLDWVGTNKFYFFKTNPNAVGNWGIAGTFRIKRLVPHDEIVEECKKAGVPVQKWVGGYHPEDSGLSVEKVDEMYEQGKEQKLMDITYDDNGELIPLSKRFDTKKRDIRFALNEPEDPGRKPRKRRGESEREYERRLEEWKRKKQEYEDAIANGWTPVDRDNDTVGGELDKLKLEEMMDPSPGRGRDESQEDYDVRYEAWKERDNARRQRMEELRQENLRHQAELGEADDMTDDQHLWEGSVPPQDEWGEDMTIEEYREMREKMGEVGTDLGKSWSKKQMKKDIHEEIIQRRKFMEESNLEDVFFTEDLKSVAKKAGDDWKNILRDVPYFIEYDKTVERLKQEELGQRFEAGERDLTIDDVDVSYNPFQSRPENKAILEEVAKMVEDWFQDAYNLMNEEGVLFGASKLEDYVTHIWDFDKSPADAVEKYKRYRNALRMRSPYTRHRVLPSLQEGLEMGLVPKYEDITGIILDYGHRMNEVIANKRLVDFIRQFALEVDNGEGEPTLMPILIPEWKKDPDYVRVDNESLENYRVLRDAVPFISPVFGRQRVLDPTAHPELQKWLDRLFWNPSNLMKKLNLSASFFHHGALTETAIALTNPVSTLKGLSKNIFWDWLYKGNVPAMVSREETRDAVRHLVSLGATNDYAATEVQNLTTQLKQMLEKMPAKGAGSYYVAAALDFLNAKSDKLLWDVIHDGFKLRSYTKMATEIRKQAEKEGWSIDKTDKALDEIGQFVNDTFGGQHWDVLGISPMKERMLRAMLLSPDWTISTIRQALAPLGVGTLYESDSFWQKMKKNGLGKTLSDTTPEGLRKKYGRHFWLKAGLFFGIMVNALNAWNRLKDEDEQKKMADERRKTDPGYKSPYELAYPDGMKWYDYTMFGNSVGQTSHLFIGRDDKGREAYARWGKQFRELPELFIDNQSGQFTFPGAMINKMAGKANPLVGTMFTLLSGHSLSGWENEDMKGKKGREKDVARLFVLAKSFMPYSIPKDDDKEFMLIDLVMPTSKGLSNYKARQYMEKAILSGDMDYVQEVYKACVQNGIDPDKIFEVVKSTIESDAKKEMLDGVENIDDAIREYDSSIDVEKKKKLAKFIEKQLSAQDYEQIEMTDLLGKAQSFLNGESESEEKNAEYIARSSSEDVIADWRMKKVKAGVQKYYDTYKSLLGEDDDFDSPETKEAADYLRQNKDRIALYQLAGKYQYRINKMKKMLDEGVYGTAVFKMIKACKEDFFEKAEHPSEAMEDETWEEFDFDDAEDVNDAR